MTSSRSHTELRGSLFPRLLSAWRDVTVACIQHAWRPLLTSDEEAAASETSTTGREMQREITDALSIAQRIPGFDGVTEQEFMDLVDMQQEEQTAEEMVEEADEDEEEDQADQAQEEQVVGQLPASKVRDLLSHFEAFMDVVHELDNQTARVETASSYFKLGIQPYKDLYKTYLNVSQQSLITSYFKPQQPSVTSSQQQEEEQDIEDILAEIEDDDVISSYEFTGFSSEGEEEADDPDSD